MTFTGDPAAEVARMQGARFAITGADAPAIAPKGYVWPAAALAAAALFLGVAAPDGLMQTIASAASAVLGEGGRP